MSFIDPYRLDPAQGSHDLMRALRSYRHWSEPEDISGREAVLIGSAAHCLVLEPDEFDQRYRQPWTPPPGAVETTAQMTDALRAAGVKGYSGKKRDDLIAMLAEHCPDVQIADDLRAEFEATDQRTELGAAAYDRVLDIAAAVRTDRQAAAILADAVGFEVPGYWTDPATGVACKRKLDIELPAGLADLKTCACPYDFGQRLRYADTTTLLQFLHYRTGGQVLRGLSESVYIIAVGSTPPHDVVVYRLDPDLLERAADNYRRALSRVRHWQALEIDVQMGTEQPIDPQVTGYGSIVNVNEWGPQW